MKIFGLRINKVQEEILEKISLKNGIPKNSIVMIALLIYIRKNL